MKVGLVLGAGGIQGGAWLTGALDALAERDRLGPGGSRLRGGHLRRLDDRRALRLRRPALVHGRPLARGGVRGRRGRRRAAGRRGRPRRRRPVPSWSGPCRRSAPAPGGWRSARSPTRAGYTPATVFSGWIPRGIFSTASLKDTIRRVVPSGWSPHPNLWVVACDYETGRRVPFGRAGAPAGRPRRRRRRLLRHPGHLPPADDRRAPLRRRRHLLHLERRPAPRRGPRPGHLPQPDLHPAPDPGAQPSRVA